MKTGWIGCLLHPGPVQLRLKQRRVEANQMTTSQALTTTAQVWPTAMTAQYRWRPMQLRLKQRRVAAKQMTTSQAWTTTAQVWPTAMTA